jgi:hypothetical protein
MLTVTFVIKQDKSKSVPVRAMKTYRGSEDMAPYDILNLICQLLAAAALPRR